MNRVGPGRHTRPSRPGSAAAASTVVARWRESHWTSMRLTSSQTQRPLSSAENMLNHQVYCCLMWKMNFGRGGIPLLDTASWSNCAWFVAGMDLECSNLIVEQHEHIVAECGWRAGWCSIAGGCLNSRIPECQDLGNMENTEHMLQSKQLTLRILRFFSH